VAWHDVPARRELLEVGTRFDQARTACTVESVKDQQAYDLIAK